MYIYIYDYVILCMYTRESLVEVERVRRRHNQDVHWPEDLDLVIILTVEAASFYIYIFVKISDP